MLGAACRLYAGRRSPRRPCLRRSGLPPVAPSVESSRRYAQRHRRPDRTDAPHVSHTCRADLTSTNESSAAIKASFRCEAGSVLDTTRALSPVRSRQEGHWRWKGCGQAVDMRAGGQTGWVPFGLAVGLPLSRVHAGPSFADRRARRAAELFQRRPPRQHAPLRRVPFESGCLTRLSAIRTFRSRVEATPSE